jgi:Flp pilus assembly protein TadB
VAQAHDQKADDSHMNNQLPQDLVQRYKEKLKQQLELSTLEPRPVLSREYQVFKQESLPGHMGVYERACLVAGKLLKIRVDPKRALQLQEAIDICHLAITPSNVIAFSILFPIAFMIVGAGISLAVWNSLFFTMFSLLAGIAFMFVFGKYPLYLANNWRMKASNQMVLCIFYVVTYMRHTSNLELAIEFASEHLTPPLALDLKKILWDVETQKYESVKESLELYLETWRQWNSEFVESFHLIVSSLYEASEERRLGLLDKSLNVILEETYERMLHYAQNLKGPITMVHMLGIILPILGLVILPLMVSFMAGVAWYHIATVYNVILPLLVYLLGKNVLSKRPTGYGDTDIAELNPSLKRYRNLILKLGPTEVQIQPLFVCLFVGCLFFLIGLIPIILHTIQPDPSYDIPLPFGFRMLEYRTSPETGELVGPFGMGASLLSLAIPLALAFSIGLYFKLRSQNVIKIREQTKKLEDEFASALFQLGNRLGDGLPAEIAFARVAEVMPDTVSGKFFHVVATNIAKLGMGVREALFNPRTGALVYFPSNVIQSSMKVLVEGVKKGPVIAGQALLNVSRYIKEIHKVNERLKDLMADVISDMKSQINFLTPAIAGIVIAITSMITYILGALAGNIQNLGTTELGGRVSDIAGLFGVGIPTYFFQLVVGVYVFQIVYILTILSNGIENGADSLQERYLLGNNLIKSTTLYCTLSLIMMIVFNLIASRIVGVAGVVAG